MKILRWVARLLAGTVFIFSGFVKGIDMTGSVIKFDEYFQAFHLDFLSFLSPPLSYLFPAIEFMIGISLFFNLRPRAGAWGLLLFMAFFTPLTLILALFNPVSDCGCFGDALVLTNWQTFYKNLILLALAILLFAGRKQLSSSWSPPVSLGLLLVFFAAFTTLSVYSYRHLPVIDFRPYSIGTNIPEKMTFPEDAPRDVYKTILIYEKNGIQKEFTTDNFPWQDSTWKFVDQHSTLLKKGYTPPIHDFSITLPDGTDITDQVLTSEGYTFLLVSPDFEKADTGGLHRALPLYRSCQERNIAFYVVTASPKGDAHRLRGAPYPIPWTNMDETTCKTIIRSNPGLVLLKKGTILGKWHYRDIPAPSSLKGDLLARQVTLLRKHSEMHLVLLLISAILLTAALGTMIDER